MQAKKVGGYQIIFRFNLWFEHNKQKCIQNPLIGYF